METKGIIFDLKKFAIHDGPGIRSTVFFKGCPLRCHWCHNPESMSIAQEIMVFSKRCLADCRACIELCKHKALSKDKDGIILNRDLCTACGLCTSACPVEALPMAGRKVSVDQVIAELAKDAIFYQDSGGGVTFSGGEPLAQIDFLYELLQACKKQSWHTAVDTCGYAPFASFKRILPLVDLFLYDLKIIDEAEHRRLTGLSNHLILENLSKLSCSANSLAIRIPLIPGCNDSVTDIKQLADFCASLPCVHPVHILPYHQGGNGKRKRLDQSDPLADTLPPTTAALQKIMEIFQHKKISVTIGG